AIAEAPKKIEIAAFGITRAAGVESYRAARRELRLVDGRLRPPERRPQAHRKLDPDRLAAGSHHEGRVIGHLDPAAEGDGGLAAAQFRRERNLIRAPTVLAGRLERQ